MNDKNSVPTPLSSNGELLKVGRLLEALGKLIKKSELTPEWEEYVVKSLKASAPAEELTERG